MKGIVEQRLGVPVCLDNDVNLAALAEHRFGAGKGVRDMIYVTTGSGIGAGIIIDNRLYRGTHGTAGEIGHTTLDIDGPVCTCGNRGCLMAMASGIGITNIAKREVKKGKATLIGKMVGNDIDKLTARVIKEAASRGDEFSRQLIERAVTSFGVGLANLIEIFDPEMIVIGGGLSQIKEDFLDCVRKIAARRIPKQLGNAVKIVRSSLGGDAGIIGAALLIAEEQPGVTNPG